MAWTDSSRDITDYQTLPLDSQGRGDPCCHFRLASEPRDSRRIVQLALFSAAVAQSHRRTLRWIERSRVQFRPV